MIGSKKIVCVIPARLKSTRFPKKMLSMLAGKPLLQWVWEKASAISLFDEVAFAVDAEETARLIDRFHGKHIMTSEQCPSGTDRLVELMRRNLVDADIWVNWQGDEPFINEEMIQDLLQTCETDGSDVWTLKKKIEKMEMAHSPHVAKVVCDHRGFALYFSRSMIPYYRDASPGEHKLFFKHIGMYAYTREALQKISQLKPCEIELAEQLEQLRFLYNNLKIRVHETQHEVFGIDLPEHLAAAESFVARHLV
ncbi:MAG: 3-deoxy-manno-octulosonate cytidylyltransferase [Verrucomicrobia bacterium]|nr:3-deoxy-manno-octulosonate cytidylyltransferase [Verrucomicrobiota bacterium]